MPTKIPSPQKKKEVSSRQKKTDAAVSLFRKEVEEQERLVEALRTHQLDRNARVDRIKALLASGSELASAVGAWEGSGKQEDNKAPSSSHPLPVHHHHVDPSLLDSDQADNAANDDHAAPAVSGEDPTDTVVLAPPQTDVSRTAVTDNEEDGEEKGMPLSVDTRVSEIKGLAANMMQAVLEEFGGYMAGMEQHRAVLEEIRRSSPSAKQPIVVAVGTAEKRGYNGDADLDVEAEEEAALNELVAFRQSIKDKRKKKKAKRAAQRATHAKNPSVVATPSLDPSATDPSHQPLSPDADLYVNLFDKLLADGGNTGVEGGGVAGGPPPSVDVTGSCDGDAPSWLSEFEPSSTVGVTAGNMSPASGNVSVSPQAGGGSATVAVAANGRRPRRPIVEEEECYSDDFEA